MPYITVTIALLLLFTTAIVVKVEAQSLSTLAGWAVSLQGEAGAAECGCGYRAAETPEVAAEVR